MNEELNKFLDEAIEKADRAARNNDDYTRQYLGGKIDAYTAIKKWLKENESE